MLIKVTWFLLFEYYCSPQVIPDQMRVGPLERSLITRYEGHTANVDALPWLDGIGQRFWCPLKAISITSD